MAVWKRIRAAEVRETIDGVERICWPSIIQYKSIDGDGVYQNYPDAFPYNEGNAHQSVAYDLEAVEALRASGLLYDPRHTGFKSKIYDGRRAPGA